MCTARIISAHRCRLSSCLLASLTAEDSLEASTLSGRFSEARLPRGDSPGPCRQTSFELGECLYSSQASDVGLVMTFPPTVEIELVTGHRQRQVRIQISLLFVHLQIDCALKFSLFWG